MDGNKDNASHPVDEPNRSPLDEEGIRLLRCLVALESALASGKSGESATSAAVADTLACLGRLGDLLHRDIYLAMHRRIFHVCDRPLHLDHEGYLLAQKVGQTWRRLGIGELLFPARLERPVLETFVKLLDAALSTSEKREELFKEQRGQIQAFPLAASGQDITDRGPAEAINHFSTLVLLLRSGVRRIQAGQPLPLRPIRRLLVEIMASLAKNGGLLLSICYSPEARKEQETHAVCTTLHALVIGQRLSLPHRELMDLALAAFLHSLAELGGGSRRPDHFAAEKLDDGSDTLQRIDTIYNLLRSTGLGKDWLSAPLSIYEGQQGFRRTDLYQPGAEGLGSPGLYARIVALCCLYDRLIWPWGSSAARIPTAERLESWRLTLAALDPALVRIFVEVMGLFPIGSLVELSSGEIAVVVAQRKGSLDRPLVLTVIDTQRGLRLHGPLIDLGQQSERKVVGLADPVRLGINPVACFLPRKREQPDR